MADGAGLAQIRRRIIKALAPLDGSARYKAAYGGRGGGKSHHFAEEVVERMVSSRTRLVCLREVQNTLRESCRELILSKIREWGVGDLFDVTGDEIRGPHGSLCVFRGMQSFNADNIKSLEDFDVAWFEEAHTCSARSLRLLRPTLRKPGAQMWFSWNPRHDTDAVDAFFRSESRPASSIVVPCSWLDNPYLSPDVVMEAIEDYRRDQEEAEHVWGGGYELISDASYYAKLLRAAENEGRVGDFGHIRGLPVHTSWDIGVDDYTAIWFWQDDGRFPRVIDYWEAQNQGAEEIVETALPEYHADPREGARRLVMSGRLQPYRYGTHFFPPDVQVREWGHGARSRVETLQALGLQNIHRGARTSPEERISASRTLLPSVRFADTKRVRLGIKRLRRYQRKMNEQLGIYIGPLHDENSHGADAFGEYAYNAALAKLEVPASRPAIPRGAVSMPGPPGPRPTARRTRL